MRKSIIPVLALFLPLGLAAQTGYLPRDLLPLQLGNTWTYRMNFNPNDTSTLEVQAGTDAGHPEVRALVDASTLEQIHVSADQDGIREWLETLAPDVDIPQGATLLFGPPLCLTRPVINVGESCPSFGTALTTIPDFSSVPFSLGYTGISSIAGVDTVTVPFGTFTAVRIVVSLTVSGTVLEQPFSVDLQQTYWLADGLGIVKLIDADGNTVELVAASVDEDGDGSVYPLDNCPRTPNADQLDTDADGAGDACDEDDDNDGLPDTMEATLGTNPLSADTDGDGYGDKEEVDAGRNPRVDESRAITILMMMLDQD